MKLFAVLAFAALSVTAAPVTFLIGEASREQVVVAQRPEPVKILKQIHQLNDDGSYTFGFEAADGSFRQEVRDVTGHVAGRYGYVDANGHLQELEYVSGQLSGKNLGFQAKSSVIPVSVVPVAPPPVDQKALDFHYSSVDDNQDGHPDHAVQQVVLQAPTVLRYVEEAPVQTVVVQQAKQTVVPLQVVPVGAPTVDQRNLDYQYSSVDENQDGQPDAPAQQVVFQAPTVYRYVEEAPVQKVLVQEARQTVSVVPIAPPAVDQRNLDYQYSSVDENQDGQPDAPVQQVVLQAPTVYRYVEEAPIQTVVVQQAKQTVVPVVVGKTSTTVDQKHLDYRYSSVDDNQDGQPDGPVSIVRFEEVPTVVHTQQTVVPVVLGQTSTSLDQKALDYRYSSVDENQDGHPDGPVSVVRLEDLQATAPVVISKTSTSVDQKHLDYQYSSVDENQDGQPDGFVQKFVVQTPTLVEVQSNPSVVPVSVVTKTSSTVDQKVLDYRYSSVDDNQDGIPDAAEVVVQNPTFVRYEAPAFVRVIQTVAPVPELIARPTVIRTVQQVGNGQVDQFIKDLRYHSVDADEDGIPDEAIDVASLPVVQTVVGRFI